MGGHCAELDHHGQLGDPDSLDLAETAVSAAGKASVGELRHLCGRDSGAGAEGGWKAYLFEVSDVGLWQRKGCGGLPEWLCRLPSNRRLRRLQPGNRLSPLWLLAPYVVEMVRDNAEGCHHCHFQSRNWI